MKKRLLSIILAICMVVALAPVMLTMVSAASCTCLIQCTDSYRDVDCPVCKTGGTGGACTGRTRLVDKDGESIVDYKQLGAIMSWPASQRDYYYFSLDWPIKNNSDLTILAAVPEDADIVIDLNGKTLDGNKKGTIFEVSGKLTIIDTKGGGRIINATGGAFHILGGGSVLMQGGTIENCINSGGVIVESGGTFQMTGGTVKNNRARATGEYGPGRNITVNGSGIVYIGGDAQVLCCDADDCNCSGRHVYLREDYANNLSPTLYANRGKIKGTIYNEGKIDYQPAKGWGTYIYGHVENFGTIDVKKGSKFYSTVTNNGSISSGTFLSAVTNNGSISGGSFKNSTVTNNGSISGGNFQSFIINNTNGSISGGGFEPSSGIPVVTNYGSISGGFFEGGCSVYNYGTISGGTFCGTVKTVNGTITDSAKVPVYFVTNTGKSIATRYVLRGQRLPDNEFPSVDPTRYGYSKFDGWDGFSEGRNFFQDVNYLTAKFTNPITYTITYLGGGTANPANPTTYTVESDAITLNNPTENGYVFTGWSEAGSNAQKMTVTIPKGSIGNKTYTAHYIDKHLYEVNTASSLQSALNSGATTIQLIDDITLSSLLDLSDRIITLDLNGHTLTGDIKLADTSANPESILTLEDSSTAKNGVLNGKITLTRGNGSTSHLYANGGTVTGMVSLPSYAGGIFCTSDTPTVFQGYVGNYGEIHGGIFYGSVKESCIKEKTVTFMNGSNRYALEVVANGSKVVAPAASPVKAGYAFDGWYKDGTAYTFGSALSENITLTAKFGAPITYKITYNLGGGTADNPASYTVERDAITLNNPTKSGYTFTGWSGTGLNAQKMTVTIPKGSTGNRSYTANWTPATYTVTLNAVGGKIKSGNVTNYTYGQGATLPTDVTKTGYTFKGWYDNEGCTGSPVTAISTTDTGEKKYWAKWEVNQYTITFNFNDDTPVSAITQDYGTTVTAPAAPTREGFSFGGWYTDSELKNSYVFSTMPANDITLYAKWNQTTGTEYTVEHKFKNLDGSTYTTETEKLFGTEGTYTTAQAKTVPGFTAGSVIQQKIQGNGSTEIVIPYIRNTYTLTVKSRDDDTGSVTPVKYGAAITAPTNPVKTGYTFAGWDKEIPATMPAEDVIITAIWSPLNGTKYTVEHKFENLDGSYTTETEELFGTTGKSTAATVKNVPGFTAGAVTQQQIAAGGSTKIEINYTRNTYTLTVKPENGEDDIVTTVKYGAVIVAPVAPTRTGYTFVGWDTEIPATMPAKNVTIKAQWTITQYTITFNSNGGTDVAAITDEYGAAVTGPAAPTREGYDFGGWYTDSALTTGYTFSTMPAESITLYAKWNPLDGIKYTVKHNFENPNDSNYTTVTEKLFGTTDTDTAATAKNVTGFTAGPVIQQKIQGNGSTEIVIPYIRNRHTLTFKPENGEDDIVTTVKYGAAIVAPVAPTRTGYTFDGWDKEIPETMPAEDVTITAKWTAIPVIPTYPPTVAQPDEGGSVTISTKNPTAGSKVTITPTPDEGFEVNEIIVTDRNGNPVEVTDNGDGTFSFKQPYGKVTITVTFKPEKDPVKDCTKDDTCPAAKFTDVKMDWTHDGIHYCVENGLMNGTGDDTFEPAGTAARAMLVTVLYRLEGEPEVGECTFSDVPEGEWYTDAVIWAAENKLVEGYDGKFEPTDDITREQFATILYRYAVYKGYDVTASVDLTAFADGEATADWAEAAMSWAVGAGLFEGKGENNLDPTGKATRAEMAAILYRFCENVVE